MKTLLALLLAIFGTQAFGQEKVFSVSPDKPKVGDEIVLTYNDAAPAALLKNASSMTAQTLVYRLKDSPLLVETPLKKDGSLWKGSFTLKEAAANFLIFRFKADEKLDDNKGDVWESLVYTTDGKAAQGGHLSRSDLFGSGGFNDDFKHSQDADVAGKEAALETELYPDNLEAHFALWSMQMKGDNKEAARTEVRKELDELYAKHKSENASAGSFIRWYNILGDTATANQVRDAALTADPKGEFAQNQRVMAIQTEADPDKSVEMMKAFEKDFPDFPQARLEGAKAGIARAYMSRKMTDKAAAYMETLTFPLPNTCKTLSLRYLDQEGKPDKAVYWAKKAVSYTDALDLSRKPSYVTEAQYSDDNKSTRAMLLDHYGKCLVKAGNTEEGIRSLEEAYTLTKGEDIDINTHYVDILSKAGKTDKAVDVAMASVKSGKFGDELVSLYRGVYAKQKGSEEGFDVLIADARKAIQEKMKKEVLASRIAGKPAIDFTLRDLNGTSITLAALKGKVVVVDFWATWCGPCKQSFPHLQKVYEKYKDNKDVRFLAIDTWETKFKDYDAQEANAKSYVEDNKYTFPVLIDQGAVIDKYEVEGIPTQFIIDRNGKIAFRTVGYEGAQMEDQLSAQIDVLLEESVGMR